MIFHVSRWLVIEINRPKEIHIILQRRRWFGLKEKECVQEKFQISETDQTSPLSIYPNLLVLIHFSEHWRINRSKIAMWSLQLTVEDEKYISSLQKNTETDAKVNRKRLLFWHASTPFCIVSKRPVFSFNPNRIAVKQRSGGQVTESMHAKWHARAKKRNFTCQLNLWVYL